VRDKIILYVHMTNIRITEKTRWYSTKAIICVAFFVIVGLVGLGQIINAAATSEFQVTINSGTLSVDIADSTSSYSSVGSPSVTFSAQDFSFSCGSTSGTLGTATEAIYVQNPDAADSGWTVSIAASATTDVWDSTGTDFDFNDPTTSGCADGADADSLAGQLTVDASGGTLSAGDCSSCTTANISLGSSNAFNEGTVDSVTLLTAAAGSDDIGDWQLTGVSLSQTIPAEQPAASDYTLSMTLSVVAS
jgi:hypothetical protein